MRERQRRGGRYSVTCTAARWKMKPRRSRIKAPNSRLAATTTHGYVEAILFEIRESQMHLANTCVVPLHNYCITGSRNQLFEVSHVVPENAIPFHY